ncbi:MAG: hypothetical protein M1133_01540 [Armatimonadetes bacterium]|nr:hypothetical protein [Armatimonadota bacterium]
MRYLWLIAGCLILMAGPIQLQDYERFRVGLLHTEVRLALNRHIMGIVAGHVRTCKRSTGSYPSPDQGLLAVKSLKKHIEKCDYRNPLLPVRVTPSGVLSPWGEPYIYENRQALKESIFVDSGATLDKARAYSVRVDRGIYIWSVAAQQHDAEYRHWTHVLGFIRVLIAVVGIGCLVVFLLLTWRRLSADLTLAKKLFGMVASAAPGLLISFGLLAVFFPVFVRTCYAWSRLTLRTPERTKDYIAVLRRYHDRGVISDRAYRKLLLGLIEDEKSEAYRQD